MEKESVQKSFVTDLFDRSEDTIILQPAVTVGMRKFEDISRTCHNFPSPHSHEFNRCIWETVHSIRESKWFVHTGTLKTKRVHHLEGEAIAGYDYKYCGDFFETTVNDRGELSWYCENCKTKMRFHHIKQADVKDLLLHLLIKQMVPSLRTGNYIWTQETGVVAILANALAYKPNDQKDSFSFNANFGFVLMPGMQTLTDQGAFGEWLRYLVQIKFDQLQVTAESQMSGLIGPKHSGSLAGSLRFWR